MITVTVSDFYRAQYMIRMANDGKTYRGMFRDAIMQILMESTLYAQRIAPKDTGHLMGAITYKYDGHRLRGSVLIGEGQVWYQYNTRRDPQVYGVGVQKLGGDYAFMKRTWEEKTTKIAPIGMHAAMRRIPWP